MKEPGKIGAREVPLHFFVEGDSVVVLLDHRRHWEGFKVVAARYSCPEVIVEFPDASRGKVDYRRLVHVGDLTNADSPETKELRRLEK